MARNLKQYSKKYDEEDEALLQQADADVLQERQRLLDEWSSWYSSKEQYARDLQDFKKKMYGDKFAEKPFSMESVTVEMVMEVKEEPYQTSS